jgi:hypothetical protein
VRRLLYWTGVVVGVCLVAGGSALAADKYHASGGPDGAVRGYFAALARADAPAALAYGDVPAGPRTLLTSEVLAVQQRLAPLRDVVVTGTRRTSPHAARVDVRYTLAFPGDARTINASLRVHETGGAWRLDAVAIRTRLTMPKAGDRAGIVGAPVPAGEVVLFPGVVPITFDTPYLQLNATEDTLSFGPEERQTQVYVDVSAAGQAAAVKAVSAALQRCLRGGDISCPLPNGRYVPGSVRGSLQAPLRSADVTVDVGDGRSGVLAVSGEVGVSATYTKLTFSNQRRSGHGTVQLPFDASGYAVSPLAIHWTSS